MSIDTMKQALEALELHGQQYPHMVKGYCIDAITALRAAIEQAEKQEPVAWTDAPKTIYLQVCEENNCDEPFDSHIEVSWCQDKINDSDIPYVRADIKLPIKVELI